MSSLIYEIYALVPALNPATVICDVYCTIIVHCLHLRAGYIIFLHLYESLPYLLKRELSALGQRGHVAGILGLQTEKVCYVSFGKKNKRKER
jgi:hypothetical protein